MLKRSWKQSNVLTKTSVFIAQITNYKGEFWIFGIIYSLIWMIELLCSGKLSCISYSFKNPNHELKNGTHWLCTKQLDQSLWSFVQHLSRLLKSFSQIVRIHSTNSTSLFIINLSFLLHEASGIWKVNNQAIRHHGNEHNTIVWNSPPITMLVCEKLHWMIKNNRFKWRGFDLLEPKRINRIRLFILLH